MAGKYYVITNDGVITAKSLMQINNKLKIKLEDVEMQNAGADKIIKIKPDDIDFLQDKRRLEKIPIANLYKTDSIQKYMMIGMMIMTFIILVRG